MQTNRGVPVQDFLQLAFRIKSEKYNALSSEMGAWNIFKKKEFTELMDLYNSAKKEVDMYEPFVKMGNMILDHSEEKEITARKVCLVDSTKKALQNASSVRFPDIILAPKEKTKNAQNASSTSAGKRREENSKKTARVISVYETLVPFEFKFPEDLKVLGKRKDTEGFEIDAGGIGIPVEKEEITTVDNEVRSSSKHRKPLRPGFLKGSSTTTSTADSLDPFSSSDPSEQAKAEASLTRTKNSGRLQLAGYASELLNARGDRSHVFGVRVNDRSITFTYYHKAAIVEAVPFNLSEHPLYLALFLTRFQKDPSAIGFCADIGFHNPFDLEDITTRSLNTVLEKVPRDAHSTLKQDFVLDQIQVGDVVDTRPCLIGRGTTVRDVIIPGIDINAPGNM